MPKPPSDASETDRVAEGVLREKYSYDEGDTYQRSAKLHHRFRHVFTCPNTRFFDQYMQDRIGEHVADSVVLDYGCGTAWFSVPLLGLRPKRLVGIDISQKAVEQAIQNSGGKGEFLVMDAHKLDFPDNTFDLIFGRAILHHLEFPIAVQEVRRVLKKGGHAAFSEPLLDNPLRKVFQLLTRRSHTRDELPLSRRQIQWADSLFEAHEHLYCGFFSTALGVLTSLLPVSEENFFLVMADKLDRYVTETPLRYWMRYVYLIWRK
jgi:SAM-dependent methyltransferase